MIDNKQRFFKGLQGFQRSSDELEAKDAYKSVYRWWWEFLRLSPVFWFARKTGINPVDPTQAHVYIVSGDLASGCFYTWWKETGRYIFAEAKRPSKVVKLDLDNLHKHEFKENSLYLEIPLKISKGTLLRKIKELINEEHEGRKLNVAATSNAVFKLHTKRDCRRTLEIEYLVMLYKLLYRDIAIWRVGDRLQLAPHIKVRLFDLNQTPEKVDKLNAITGRFLYKARFTLLNAERNSFPNMTKIILPEDFQPFGKKHDKAYQAAIGKVDGVESEWHKWLHEEYAEFLRDEIVRRNKIDGLIRMPDSKVRKRLPDFITGKSDELN